MPDPDDKYAVYQLQGGSWVRLKAESFGSYLCFPLIGSGVIAVTEAPSLPAWVWAAGAGGLALVLGLVLLFGRSRSRKKPKPTQEPV